MQASRRPRAEKGFTGEAETTACPAGGPWSGAGPLL